MKKIRYAVVGTGSIVQEAFLPGLAKSHNSVLSAVVSGRPEKARNLAAAHGATQIFAYEQYADMLKSGIVDAVYIALPNDLHAKFTIPALRAGVHALVEKPLATTVADAEAMIAAAKAGGAKLMTAYRLHCDEATRVFMQEATGGAIGKPRIFTSTFCFPIDPANHRLASAAWGGPLQDVGVYCVNAARHVFAAEPVDVIASAGRDPTDGRFADVDETVSAILRFPDDGLAVFSASFGTAVQDRIGLLGTNGQIDMFNAYRYEVGRSIHMANGETNWKKEFPYTDNFTRQIDYFSTCITANSNPGPDGMEGLKDLKILLAIEQAARTGQRQVLR
jgi:predicted dehydrogenase